MPVIEKFTLINEALEMAQDKRAFVEDLEEFYEDLGNGLIADPAVGLQSLAKEHGFSTECQFRLERVKAFMRECGIKQKYDYGYAELSDLPNFSIYACTDMQILMLLLGIDCPDYKDYFFTSKGELLNNKTRAPIDLWGFLDHYGIEYKQRGPKFNSQTLGVSVGEFDNIGQLNILDIFIATDKPKNAALEVILVNNPQCARFVKKLIQTHLPEECEMIQKHNGYAVYIAHNSHDRHIGSSSRTAIAWGLHAAIHGLETPAAVFTGSIDRNSGKIEPIGGMDAKHAEAESVGLAMIVPQENLYKRYGMPYTNTKPASSVQELFRIASSMDTLNRPRPHLDKSRYTVKPFNTSFARLLHKLP